MRHKRNDGQHLTHARRLVPAVTIGLAFSLAAACSNGHDDSGLPSASPSTSASPSRPSSSDSPTLSPDEQAAVAAADAYERTVDAMSGGDPIDVHKLERYATKAIAVEQAKNLAELKSVNLETRGASKMSLINVTVQGSVATVKRCIDGSKVVIYKRGASKPFGPSRGLPASTTVVQMVKQGGAWLLAKREKVGGQKCSTVSS